MAKLSFIFITASVFATAAPAHADPWNIRRGLWELITSQDVVLRPLPPDMPADQRARMEAMRARLTPPKPVTTQFCQRPDSPPVGKPAFDPANAPPGACRETITAETISGRDVEDICEMPLALPNGATTPVTVHVEVHRHVILSGDGAGSIDRLDVSGGPPGGRLIQNFRWLGTDCGSVPR